MRKRFAANSSARARSFNPRPTRRSFSISSPAAARQADRALHRGAAANRGRLRAGRADQPQADRRARPLGIRPLVIGELEGRYILASETCALDILGARFVRDVENGEIVVISEEGIESIKPFPKQAMRPASSNIFISRAPTPSCMDAPSTTCARRWARNSPASAGSTPMSWCGPDSGVPAALGYSREAGIPFELGIIRNHYVGRTLSSRRNRCARWRAPEAQRQSLGRRRQAGHSDRRLYRARDDLREDRADDARRRRDGGAFPDLVAADHSSDYYGIDTPQKDKLLAATHSLEEMRAWIGSDSLAFLSIDGIYRAWASLAQQPGAAVHRPLLHRRLSDGPHRSWAENARSCRCWRRRAEATKKTHGFPDFVTA